MEEEGAKKEKEIKPHKREWSPPPPLPTTYDHHIPSRTPISLISPLSLWSD